MDITRHRVVRSSCIILGSLCLIVGCARNDDAPGASSPATRPTAIQSPTTQQTESIADNANAAPMSSTLLVDNVQQFFPPAQLRVSTSGGKVVAHLYSEDTSGNMPSKNAVNSFDFSMELPGIHDPSQIGSAIWMNYTSSLEKQDSPYGIFLANQHAVLQPMNVTVRFKGEMPNVRLIIQGSFGKFPQGDDLTSSAGESVRVVGVLDASTPKEK